MSEIKIIEKFVAPNACWASIKPQVDFVVQDAPLHAIKVIFDRTYPYFWVRSLHYHIGLALTLADVERALTIEEDNSKHYFDLYTDGVTALRGCDARCIAMGARKAFYVLPYKLLNSSDSCTDVIDISAQDDPVCPFVVNVQT